MRSIRERSPRTDVRGLRAFPLILLWGDQGPFPYPVGAIEVSRKAVIVRLPHPSPICILQHGYMKFGRRWIALAALPLLLAGIAGCGVQEGRSAPSDEGQNVLEAESDTSGEDSEGDSEEAAESDGEQLEESAPEENRGKHYASAEELVQAYRDAGGKDCAETTPSTELSYASSALSCGEDVTFSVYDDRRDRISQVTSAVDASGGENDAIWLMGMTWIIEAPDAEQLQEELGGKVIDFSELRDHHSRGERHSGGDHQSEERRESREE